MKYWEGFPKKGAHDIMSPNLHMVPLLKHRTECQLNISLLDRLTESLFIELTNPDAIWTETEHSWCRNLEMQIKNIFDPIKMIVKLTVKIYGLLLLVPVMVFLLLTELAVLLEVSVWVQGQAACWQSSASQSSPTQLELDGQARALLRPAWSPPHIGTQMLQELQGSQEPDMSTGTWPLAMLTEVWRLSSTLWTIGWSWWLREARASWNLTCRHSKSVKISTTHFLPNKISTKNV